MLGTLILAVTMTGQCAGGSCGAGQGFHPFRGIGRALFGTSEMPAIANTQFAYPPGVYPAQTYYTYPAQTYYTYPAPAPQAQAPAPAQCNCNCSDPTCTCKSKKPTAFKIRDTRTVKQEPVAQEATQLSADFAVY